MRTVTKNVPTEITAARVTPGSVIVAPFEHTPGMTQATWAVDKVEVAAGDKADGVTQVRYHVSSPKTGKYPHTVLFGADGLVKVTGAVSGTVGRKPAAEKPATAPKGTETRKPRTRKAAEQAEQVTALTDAVASLPTPAASAPAPTSLRGQIRSAIRDAVSEIIVAEIGAAVRDLLAE